MKYLAIILGFLALFVALIVGGVGLFYAGENARGAVAWHDTLAKIKEAGEPTSVHALLPPPVPDPDNLAAMPLFHLEPDDTKYHYPQAVELKKAIEKISPEYNSLPSTGAWMRGQPTNFAPVADYFAKRYKEVAGESATDPGTLGEIEYLCPPLKELRDASPTRSRVRFNRDYETQPAYRRSLGPVTQLIKLTRIIDLHTEAALQEGKSDDALQDVELVLKLDKGVRQEPILVSGLVAAGMSAIELGSVWDGLHAHAWADAQLAALQNDLGSVDWLADYQLCMRGEALGFYAPTINYMRDHRDETALVGGMSASDDDEKSATNFARAFGNLAPRGWFDLAKANGVAFDYRGAREPVDAAAHRVYPQKARQLTDEFEAIRSYDLIDLLLRVAGAPLLHSASTMAEAQFRTDAALIACALERYHLAHTTYPPSLDALNEYAPHGLPHDPITGKAYIYKLQTDGTYLLYSVGWNEVDDGGKVVTKPDSKAFDREQGDWVWPCPDGKPIETSTE